MPLDDDSHLARLEKLKKYMLSISPDSDLHELLEKLQSSLGRSEDQEALGIATGDRELDDGNQALQILKNNPNVDLSAVEVDALEAIVHRIGRPVVDIKDDTYNSPSGEWSLLGEPSTKNRIEKILPSIGRIEMPCDFRSYAGTGFVVGDDLLMTNRHVARLFSDGIGKNGLRFNAGQSAAVDFKREVPRRNDPEPILFDVSQIVMMHPYWDMALLKVKGLTNDQKPLNLSVACPEELHNQNIVTIGYPAKDERNDIDVQLDVFDRLFEVKRMSPGKLKGRCEYSKSKESYNVIRHDSSTLGGNSGSAVIDIDTGSVVALHFAGEYLVANYAISMLDLAQDSEVTKMNLNFDSVGVELRKDFYLGAWKKVNLTKELLGFDKSIASSAVSKKSEGMFSAKPISSEQISRFSKDSVLAEHFNLECAVSLALASYVAYRSAESIKETVLGLWGFDTCEFVQQDGTECFIAGSKSIWLVAFRGTELKINDWITDMNILSISTEQGRLHGGFYSAFRSVDEKIRSILSTNPNIPISLAGHSLGGAIALIAAAHWRSTYAIQNIYTYGQPAVGKGHFPSVVNSNFNKQYCRFVNDDDIVPRLPPTYRHCGNLLEFDSAGKMEHKPISDDESVFAQSTVMSEQDFDRLRARLLDARIRSRNEGGESLDEGLLPSFGDHKMSRYIAKLVSASISVSK